MIESLYIHHQTNQNFRVKVPQDYHLKERMNPAAVSSKVGHLISVSQKDQAESQEIERSKDWETTTKVLGLDPDQ